jgi:RND family efflux transporter MFP subunit
MASPAVTVTGSLDDFACALLGEREVQPRAQIIANEIAQALDGAAVIVYVLDRNARCAARAHAGDIKRPRTPVVPKGNTLEFALKQRGLSVFPCDRIAREKYEHIDVRRNVTSLAYIPLALEEVVVAVIEIISYESMVSASVFEQIQPMTDLAAMALATAIAYESERDEQFQTITRFSQLYDLERTFNSTLQMESLLPLITSKVREALEVEAVHLWMVQNEGLMLMSSSGEDPTVPEGTSDGPGAAIAHEVLDTSKSVLARTAADPKLQARNGSATPPPVRSVLAVPVVSQNFQVGVLEVVNKASGGAFDENDAFYLATISQTAGSALHNASLLEAERKIEILETLVHVSQEITSTLNLERVLQVIVNGSQKIVSYDRAAIAIQQLGKLQVRAISGKTEVVQFDPAVKQLREMLNWAAGAGSDVYVTQEGDEIHTDREETRLRFHEHFAATGYKGWYSIPLEDEQGLLGILSFESRNPAFLSTAHLEFIKVVASQATVAIRNASLYKEVPLIGMLEPLIQKKQQFMRQQNARTVLGIGAAIAAFVLVVVPLPMRVTGDAVVAPLATSQIQATVPAVVQKVFVREGQTVRKGQVLADLEDWDYRAALAEAESKYRIALAQANSAQAANDGTEAAMRRYEADYWASEVARGKERLERTHLRAPFDGVVVGADLETYVGKHLAEGEKFCEVVDPSRARVDVEVDEDDLPLLQASQAVTVKVDGYPLKSFPGTLANVSPTSVTSEDRRAFLGRVDVENGGGLLRGGMRGRAKVKVGWRPSGYVLFRSVAYWAWSHVWSLFGS